MYYLKMNFEFEAAHRLQNHPGLCHFLHGHSYKVRVMLRAVVLDDNSMVMDFSDAKKLVWNNVLKPYDHCTILEMDDPLIAALEEQGQRVMPYNEAPTAERMASYMFEAIDCELVDTGIAIASVKVYETANNAAMYAP